MPVCLFEDTAVRHLEPLILTRHTSDLRLGMYTLAEMQEAAFAEAGRPDTLAFHARDFIADVTRQEHPEVTVNQLSESGGMFFVNARYVPEPGDVLERLRAASRRGERACAFWQGETLVAAWQPGPLAKVSLGRVVAGNVFSEIPEERIEGARMINRLWDLLDDVEGQIARDFEAGGQHGVEGTVHLGAHVAGTDVWIAPGAEVWPGAVINASDCPVVIEEGAVVEEHSVVRGPCWIGPKVQIKAASRIDSSAIGPWSKVGGEVHGSVVHSLSSKAHDGYLGNSYLGRWCNLGADTNTSNLKNDYGEVSMYDPCEEDFVGTGRQFLGLIMGDHSKCSINSMFNTGTVVGVFCNLFGSGFPPRHVPSFTWGGADGLEEYHLEKALLVAEAVMARRDTPLTDADRAMLAAVFERTAGMRGESEG
jgi:UDP-N-acetylglucosamine diphosphorylase / glucose-1-phosphate thymidylyltransferase / UDP-N-acetylgalactosamine diphosphorylase / glucosamine-1-phosphate N-acetyltransferase / galactosamine-1-phosphate N-acetyltransferase